MEKSVIDNKDGGVNDDGVQVTCFTEVSDDVTLHFQIIRLHKQVRMLLSLAKRSSNLALDYSVNSLFHDLVHHYASK